MGRRTAFLRARKAQEMTKRKAPPIPRRKKASPSPAEVPAAVPADKTGTHSNHLLITALGASAGGLEALEHFFRNMPADSGIAFVVVQHMAPDHASALPQLLARCTQMPVEE